MNIDAVIAYIVARSQEPSTWRGAVLLLTALGVKLEPQQMEAIVIIGLGIAGLLGVAFPDRKAPPPAAQ